MNKDKVKSIIKQMAIRQVLEAKGSPKLPCKLEKLIPHLKGQIHMPSHMVKHLMNFQNGEPDDFSALNDAENFLSARKYVVGRIEGDLPIAFVKPSRGIDYVAKWSHIHSNEVDIMDGCIIFTDARNGPIQIAFFEDF